MLNKLTKISYTVAAFILLLALSVSAVSAAEYLGPSYLEPQLSSDGNTLYNTNPVIVWADPNPPPEQVRMPVRFDMLTLPETATATFSITYVPGGGTDLWGESCSTFPEGAKAAFNAAATIWGNLLQSSVPITINACWSNLGSSSILGYSGVGLLHKGFTGAPIANTWYVGSLANALYGSDIAPNDFDMHITYNSNFTWYYGTDGITPAGQYDLMSVVLHEIAHGLNFAGWMSYWGGTGSWGGGTGYPIIYDRFMRDGTANPGNPLIDTGAYANPSVALGNALTSNSLWFHGTNAMAANSGQRVKIFAPSTWRPGSSYSHLDYSTFAGGENRLMVYAISSGVSTHDPGPVTLGIFKDMGWPVAGSSLLSVSPASRNVAKDAGATTFSVSNTGTGTMPWTAAVTPVSSWLSITSGASSINSGTINCSFTTNTGASARTSNIRVTTTGSSVDVTVTQAPILVTTPGAPTIGTATAGNALATVKFTPPASNGGSAITSYKVTSSPGAKTVTGSASPITITGLTNGAAYTFKATATNAAGTSLPSAASNSVTPKATPGAPIIGTATAGKSQATVKFTPPTSNGGSAITSYTVTSSLGGTATGSASPITIKSLTNGAAYTFTVTATNAAGTSSPSAASNSVTPRDVPGAPTIGTATAGNALATVKFTPSTSNGGSAITSYKVTSSPGAKTAKGGASPITITGLTNGAAYTFTVTATNAAGTSAPSAASNIVTPITAPGAPTIGTAKAGDALATAKFTPPSSIGGSAITGYTVTSTLGGKTATGSASPITVPGLTNGAAYTFKVTATNAAGTSSPSAASNSVTPKAVPGAPTIGTATAGNALATVSFTSPTSDGGSAITSYKVTSSLDAKTATGGTSPITINGLTNGAVYTFTVTATNAAGTSSPSAASNIVTPRTVPGAPTIGTATAGNAQATVTFTQPASTGGSPITGYTVTSTPGRKIATGVVASPIIVQGLTNGTAYTFKVTATNAAGTSSPSAASNRVTPRAVP